MSPDILYSETSSDTTVNEGESVSLQCTAEGFPRPTIAWRREDNRNIALRDDPGHRGKETGGQEQWGKETGGKEHGEGDMWVQVGKDTGAKIQVGKGTEARRHAGNADALLPGRELHRRDRIMK